MPVSDLPEHIKQPILATGGYTETSLVKALPYECFINLTPKGTDGKFPQENEEVPNPYARTMTPDGRGNLENYKFTGDYVMSNLPVKIPLSLYRKLPNGTTSKESDHEPVFAVFGSGMNGGKRKSRRQNKKRKNKKFSRRRN
jgi:hypothetical protein